MLFEILGIIAPVFVCAVIGYTWVRSGQSYPSEFVSKLVFNIAAPCLVVSSISQVDLSIAALSQMALASVMALALLLGFSFFVIKTLGHDVRLFSVSLTFANVGNMGLPLCLFAFGQEGLALAVAYFMVISIAHFSLGTALASGERISWGHFFKNPILFSIAIATFLVVTDYSLPHWINNSVTLIGQLTIPLMLITLGVSLANIQVKQWGLGLLYAILRFVLGGVVAVIVIWALDLNGVARQVVILQSLMPIAVFNYLFALKSGREVDTVASMVLISTLLATVVIPLALYGLL
ncbi:MAG: AEC family transporter [Gammaproteobacteria bacterium]|nr:AEC family transporter [Gammaproteobacteria bacterium]